MFFLHKNIQQDSSKVSPKHGVGFLHINDFSIELPTFQTPSRFIPDHSFLKLAKVWIFVENLPQTKRHSVFSIETLCSYT